MRVGVVGAGVAGALLAWRVRQADPRVEVHVYTGGPGGTDATGASGAMVRAFDPSVAGCRSAAASLVELREDPVLRWAAGYREAGSTYLLPPGADPADSVRVVEDLLPGSVEVRAAGLPFRDLPAGVTAVVERQAGHFSPARLRDAVLAWLERGGATVREIPVHSVAGTDPVLRSAGGLTERYDAVVLAAGPWTPALLSASGLAGEGLRAKQIQYCVYRGRPAGVGAFVDDNTGLYGRPRGDGEFQLGLPCDRWDIDPSAVRPDLSLVAEIAHRGGQLIGWPGLPGSPLRTVAAADCYRNPPGLELRAVSAGAAVFTFTGGSGGAAKTVLSASRAAAAALLGLVRT